MWTTARLAGLAGILLAATSATAQVSITAETQGNFGLFARAPYKLGNWKTVPHGTKISGNWSEKAVSTHAAGSASLEARVTIDNARDKAIFELIGRASGDMKTTAISHTTNDPRFPRSGPLSIVFRLAAPSTTTGRLVIRIDSRTSGSIMHRPMFSGAATYGSTTVSKPFTWAAPVQKEFPNVKVGPGGTVITVATAGMVSTYFKNQNFIGTVEITFVPDGKVRSFGTSCASLAAGFEAGSSSRLGTVKMQLQSNLPDGSILLALALQKTTAPIGMGHGCNLLVQPLAILVPSSGSQRTDSKGGASPILLVPNMDIRFLVQAAVLDTKGSRLALTQGLDLDCKKK